VAGSKAGGYDNYADAQRAMTGLKSRVFQPKPGNHEVYRQLFALYLQLHDAFGTTQWNGNLYDVMKQLIEIRNRFRC